MVRPALLLAVAGLVGGVALWSCAGQQADGDDPGPTTPATGLHVAGNRIVNGDGQTVRLRGFNHAGAEYMCVEGEGLFDTADGAVPSEAVVRAMRTWQGANAVRVPLNEQCWLGIGGVRPEHAGEVYQTAVRTFVARLNKHGFVAVLDLHRSAPGTARSRAQEQMPDRDHSLTFWSSVAGMFKDNSAVVFDLFNEPLPFAEENTERAWRCWRDGGCQLTSTNSGEPYTAAGMNELIAAVRTAGARNIVLAGGLFSAEVLTQWLEYRPTDPLGQLGASFHAYSFNEYCADEACYDRDLARIVAAVPLFVGEIGPDLPDSAKGTDDECPPGSVRDGDFSTTLFDWLDTHGASYTAWSWNPWQDCWALVTGWDGAPTRIWGRQVKARLAA